MGFFSRFLGRGSSSRTLQQIIQPEAPAGGEVRFDAKLVDTLLDHHARLGNTFKHIDTARAAADYDQVRQLLGEFKSSLQAHIMTENVRFYTYIEKLTDRDAESRRTMSDFRRDMNGISRQVVAFVNAYQKASFATTAERDRFAADYKKVEVLLTQRFDNEEENLYPMYAAG